MSVAARRARMDAGAAVSFWPSQMAGLALWYRADAISGLADGAAVATWPDQSGNGRDATQATSGNRPTYETGELNGKPVVRFGGGGTAKYLGYNGSFFAGTQWTLFLAYKIATPKALNGILGGTTEDNNRNLHVVWESTSIFKLGYWATDLSMPGQSTSAGGDVVTCQQSGVGRTVRKNGTQIGSDANTTLLVDYSGAEIGRFPVGSWFFNGDIAEYLAYNRAVTTTERGQVEAYLGAKYGITV